MVKPWEQGFVLGARAPIAYVHRFVCNLSKEPKSWWRSFVASLSFTGIHNLADHCRGIVDGLIKAGDRTDVLMEIATGWTQDSKFRHEVCFEATRKPQVDFLARDSPPIPVKVLEWIYEGCGMFGTVALANEIYNKYGRSSNNAYHYGWLAARHLNMRFLADWHYLFHYAHSEEDVSNEKLLLRELMQHGNTTWDVLFEATPNELGPVLWLTALHQITFSRLYYCQYTRKTRIIMEDVDGAPLVSITALWPRFSKEQRHVLRSLSVMTYTWPKGEVPPHWAMEE